MSTYKLKIIEVIPGGEYPARITKIEETKGTYGDQLKWTFDLKPINGKEHSLLGWCSATFSNKSNLYKWTCATLDVPGMAAGETLDPRDLIGKQVILSVIRDTNDKGEPFNKVKGLFPYHKPVQQPQKRQPAQVMKELGYDEPTKPELEPEPQVEEEEETVVDSSW